MGRPPKADLPDDLKRLLGIVGANIKDLREQCGMTQAALARRAKISVTTMNEIESRRFRDIRLSTMAAIADALGVSVVRLLAKSDLELSAKDRKALLKASEDLARITRKLRED